MRRLWPGLPLILVLESLALFGVAAPTAVPRAVPPWSSRAGTDPIVPASRRGSTLAGILQHNQAISAPGPILGPDCWVSSR